MDYRIGKLRNDLGVITVNVPHLTSATVSVWVLAGSRDEEDKQAGISHFLEHMGFKGGKKYKTPMAVSETIDSIGGEFNAGTGKEYTMYYVRSAASSIETSLDVLSDMLLRPQLKSADIKKEKGVIVEEINMYEDDPQFRVHEHFENIIYQGHSLGRDIAGSKKSVQSLTRRHLANYRSRYYLSGNMLVSVVGGVSHNKSFEMVKKYFAGTKPGKRSTKDKFKDTQEEPQVKIIKKKVEQAHTIVGFPSYKLGSENRYALGVLTAILGGGMSSRLFTEVREKRGLCYAVVPQVDANMDAGYFSVYVGTDPGKAQKALNVVLRELYGLAKKQTSRKISAKELNKAKEYAKGHFALAMEDSKYITRFIADEYLRLGKTRTPDDYIRGIDGVKASDLYRIAKEIFVPEKANLASIGPFTEKNKPSLD